MTFRNCGPDLSTDSFVKALESTVIPRDIFGMMEATYSPTKRLGNPYSRLSQLQDGRWRVVSDYVGFNELKLAVQKGANARVVSDQFKAK